VPARRSLRSATLEITADNGLVHNPNADRLPTTACFRVVSGPPEFWDPLDDSIRRLPEFTRSRPALKPKTMHLTK
jgi:hypothetical protein